MFILFISEPRVLEPLDAVLFFCQPGSPRVVVEDPWLGPDFHMKRLAQLTRDGLAGLNPWAIEGPGQL